MNYRGIKPDQTRQLIKRAVDQGWTWEQSGGNHIRLRGPNGELVITALTGSDRRGYLNLRALLRQKGLDV